MERAIWRETHQEQDILIIDFSGCKQEEMIEMLIEYRNTVISDGKPLLALGIFDDKVYISRAFMNAMRNEKREEVTPFIKRQAVVGLSQTKKMILKGYNLLFNRDIRPFDTKEAAIEFLISEDPQ